MKTFAAKQTKERHMKGHLEPGKGEQAVLRGSLCVAKAGKNVSKCIVFKDSAGPRIKLTVRLDNHVTNTKSLLPSVASAITIFKTFYRPK